MPNENLIFVKILSDDRGVVNYIGYDLDNTHLDQIISVFGEPKFIEFHLTSGGGVFNLFYPERGISFLGPAKRNLSHDLWIIAPETEVTLVSYTSPDLQGDAFFDFIFGDNSDLVRNGIVLWDGYKKYSFQLKEVRISTNCLRDYSDC